ncbi:hypothetical protein L3X38_037058 [Prunus dulcis]|uniref:Uncharacterized protein n=1 Tax=Prunus dulcis TaxID=3755 RepID=A0AAD4V3X4_PRUDU|nr:hypothetical protein L3X38_037058 [Prunus dulcis]
MVSEVGPAQVENPVGEVKPVNPRTVPVLAIDDATLALGQRSQPTQKGLAHRRLQAGSCDRGCSPSEDDRQGAYPDKVRSQRGQIPTHRHNYLGQPQTDT